MASYYERKGSSFYWVRFQKPDGTWGDKSSGIRSDGKDAVRKIKQHVAKLTMAEHSVSDSAGGNRFDSWVSNFLKTHYMNSKTRERYMHAWTAIACYLQHRDLHYPSQITYQISLAYPDFRTNPPDGVIRARSYNTALIELKVLQTIMQEAVRRDYITANPCSRLGLKRRNKKVKSEITIEEQAQIEEALKTMPPWMTDCWLVAMRQGCRLSETAAPLTNIDLKAGTIAFIAKGNRIHTAPLHEDVRPLAERAIKEKRKTLVELPKYPAKCWLQFFRKIGLRHLSFHCTRVTVVTRLARAGVSISQAKAYVGHASDTVHAIYQRLSAPDVRHLGEVLNNPSAENQDALSAIPKPNEPLKRRPASQSRRISSV